MTAFVTNPLPWLSRPSRSQLPRSCSRPSNAPCMQSDEPLASSVSRRAFLATAAALAATQAVPYQKALAKVDIDTERFGDKELKVSTINKVKQNIRNVLTQKPELLPYFFVMTLHDALTFNPETLDGGPNGSLRFEIERESNSPLKEAHEAIVGIQSLQRQDMSYADTCAFAGAVAVEVTGGPRIVIQLGREDASEADPEGKSSLYKAGATAKDLRASFDAAGLDGVRDVVLFHGAIGSLNDIGQNRAAKLRESSIDDGLDENGNVGDFDDITYGRVENKKRGAVLVESNVSLLTLGGQKFSNGYLKAILKAKDQQGLSQRDISMLDDSEMRAAIQNYAGNNAKFLTDVADLFQKVSLLGSQYEEMTLEA